MGRILAIDLGTRRVGLAITDPSRLISQPFQAMPFTSEKSLVETICRLAKERRIELVVIGFPLREDGSEGEICARARRVGDALRQRAIPSILWDEAWSSRDAEAALRKVGKTRRTAKGRVDSIAASLVLKDYLESIEKSTG